MLTRVGFNLFLAAVVAIILYLMISGFVSFSGGLYTPLNRVR